MNKLIVAFFFAQGVWADDLYYIKTLHTCGSLLCKIRTHYQVVGEEKLNEILDSVRSDENNVPKEREFLDAKGRSCRLVESPNFHFYQCKDRDVIFDRDHKILEIKEIFVQGPGYSGSGMKD